jgi:tetratricopeptide (TPR) repeat protein
MELIITELHQKNNIPTICLNMIVKNESKIITRMFDAVVGIINCYCICDTGSTDDTVNIITDYFKERNITGKIIHEPFKNFAHNRNAALRGCIGMSDYILLLDADMVLNVSNKFDKMDLCEDYYHIFQGSDMFYYQNTRLVRNNGLFAYVGVTHEHITTPPNCTFGNVITKDVLFINDIGDGGAKNDKFKRDISLLEKGIQDEPSNTRYYFYLGNSYRDDGEHDKAIETYKILLNMNGWLQEKFCACISIGNICTKKNNMDDAVKYWLKSLDYDVERIEGVVRAADYYRNSGNNVMVNLLYHKYKGYRRVLAEGRLFVEQDKYRDLLEYNNCISAFYANDKESGFLCCKQIILNNVMNDGLLKSTLENMRFYTDFIEKDTPEERHTFLTCIERLLTKLQIKKSDCEVWNVLNSKVVSPGFIEKIETLEELYQRLKIQRINSNHKDAMVLYSSAIDKHKSESDKHKSESDKHKSESDKHISIHSEYEWKLEYEYSVFAYYLGIRNINKQVVTILNKCGESSTNVSVLSNMKFYPNILNAEKTHDFTVSLDHMINGEEHNFKSSSSCIIKNVNSDGYLMNVRLVNYRIDNAGKYRDCDKHIITINKSIELTTDFTQISEKLIDLTYSNRLYIGIEDVRIFRDDDKILFIGTGYHQNNTIGIVHGVYSKTMLPEREIKPAFNLNSKCEKNWVYVNYKGETHVIYSWFPLKICKITHSDFSLEYDLLEAIEEKTMPLIFRFIRGSSCGYQYKNELCQNELWFVVHIVSYDIPRQYYHMLVIFDTNMNLLRYSAPFKFEGICIEYCIGLVVETDRVIMTYSTFDRTTKIGIYSKKYIDSITIYVDTPMTLIDNIYYINLDHRIDKKEQIETQLISYGLKFERHKGIFQPENCVGCTKSHLEVLKNAKERGYKNVLILEDDFMFIVSKEDFYKNMSLLLENNVDFDVCMLSYNLIRGETCVKYPFLTKVFDATTASGYIVNENFYDKLIDLFEIAIHLLEKTGQHWIYANDVIWKQLQSISKWYCFSERIGVQRPCINDNGGVYVNYEC